mgnify:CR=1 FL=1
MVKHDTDLIAASESKPAYLYARFSSQGQREGHSIERQLTYGRTHADQRIIFLVLMCVNRIVAKRPTKTSRVQQNG